MQYAFFAVNAQRIGLCTTYLGMQTPAERLREARIRAGYKTARAAAERVAVPYPTYAGHENGNRAYEPDDAARYGRAFNARPEWLLFGDLGPEPIVQTQDPQPPLAPVVKAIADSLDGLSEGEQRMIADVVRRQRALLRPAEQ